MFRNFSELSVSQQSSLESRFVLPADKSEVLVTEDLVPCELIAGSKVACTVKLTAVRDHFHTNLRHNS